MLKQTLPLKRRNTENGHQLKMTMVFGKYQKLLITIFTSTDLSFKLMLMLRLNPIQFAHQLAAQKLAQLLQLTQ